MSAHLNRITIYTKKMDEMVAFYCRHFGYQARTRPGDRITELLPPGGGAILMLHEAAKSQKMGQALVKLGFDVEDVEGFIAEAARNGLIFGPLHDGIGYVFANAKDPSGNSISVTNRAFAGEDP